jgi:hypothetical protein
MYFDHESIGEIAGNLFAYDLAYVKPQKPPTTANVD